MRTTYPTLPVSWYVDDEMFQREQQTIFSSASQYVGVIGMVPETGSFRTVPQTEHSEILVRNKNGIELLSNICLHRSMQMIQGAGKAKAFTCRMHCWSYDLGGKLLKAHQYPETPCRNLPRRAVQNWNGILFAGDRPVSADLAALGGRPELDVSNYLFLQSQEETQEVNWKIPVEVLLENYHVPLIHPGLSRYVPGSIWTGTEGTYEGEWLSYQEMPPHPDFAHNPASEVFERWQQAILMVNGGKPPAVAAIIGAYYPNTFLEWYPFMMVVTVYTPLAPRKSLMTRDFFYYPKALDVVPQFAELAKAAWDENQRQDDHVHYALQRGRELHYRRCPNDLSGYEIYQAPMEESVQLFHAKLMHAMGGLVNE
ncbi:MAG: SRPBCC family protein [Silvibacterium sp.]|jgi:phenylpropionate dioxygenase-like ring-hydroxylating dioxygenase large terminal subunit